MIDPRRDWQRLLPDLLGTIVALGLAWFMGWRTGDLIWSMWLASLVIGYCLILWKLFGPLLSVARHGDEVAEFTRAAAGPTAPSRSALFAGKLLLLAFFTIHFGGFHWGHSMFVNTFYPISPEVAGDTFSLGAQDYWHVAKTYGWFLPLAFLAQRNLFKGLNGTDWTDRTGHGFRSEREDRIKGNRGRPRNRPRRSLNSSEMATAYKGVIKLHLLIFFLFAADAVAMPEFVSFAVVYLVYFLPR